MTIICFFGPDGSGKTSLSKKLLNELSRDGVKVRYSWMRGSHTFASVASRILSRFDSFKGEKNPYYGITVPECSAWFWQYVEIISVIPIVLARFAFPQISGYTVVADRYVLDFVVWVAMTTDDREFSRGFCAQYAANMANKCDVLFFVTGEPEDLAERSGMSVDILKKQIQTYESIIKTFSLKVHTIETSRATVNDSLKRVLQVITTRGSQ